jgi:branched-subunit amino acid ABC-type transport system permease component
VREAIRSFVSSLVTMVTVLLQAIALLLPWAILLALLVLIARSRPGRALRTFFTPRPTAEPPEA